MAEDPAADLFQLELARSDRARLLARLADLDEDIQHSRLLAERAHVELSEAEMEANELGRPSSRTFLLRMTGRRGQLLRSLESRALVARISRNQMRWLQGSFDRERKRVRDRLDALPTPQELGDLAGELRLRFGDPLPSELVSRIDRDLQRQVLADAREALATARAAAEQAAAWLERARHWSGEEEGALLEDLGHMNDAPETLEGTARVAGPAAEASAARLCSQFALLSGIKGELVRTLNASARDLGLVWAQGLARAMLGSQDGIQAGLAKAATLQQHLDSFDQFLASRGAR